jgi:uncharacterized OsmC-like protein
MGMLEYKVYAQRIDTDVNGRPDAFNPAELFLAALAASMIKGIERAIPMLKFDFRGVEVKLHGVRRDSPPKMISIDYELIVDTDENEHRLELLHTNVRRFGTISNTVAEAAKLEGIIRRKGVRARFQWCKRRPSSRNSAGKHTEQYFVRVDGPQVVGRDIDRHQSRDDISSSVNLANREPGSTTVFTAATIIRRPLAGAVISCRASSIRISAIRSPLATVAPSAMNHRSTIPSGNILDAQSASST